MITVEKEISELSKVSIVYNEARKINFSLFKNKLSKYNEIYFDLIANKFVIYSYKKEVSTKNLIFIVNNNKLDFISKGMDMDTNYLPCFVNIGSISDKENLTQEKLIFWVENLNSNILDIYFNQITNIFDIKEFGFPIYIWDDKLIKEGLENINSKVSEHSVQEINFLLNRNLISLSDNIKAKFRVLCLSQYMTSYRESNIYSVGLQYSDNFKDDFKIDYQDLMILFKLNLKVDYKILRTLYFLKCIKNTPLSKRFFYFLKLKRYTIINSKSLSYDKQRKISKFNEFLESEKYKKALLI